LKRSKQEKSNISKLHKDDLFVESRYWKLSGSWSSFTLVRFIKRRKLIRSRKE
jgi:hypothetical protein